ncbi:hypothetical protein [Enterovirga sp. CN4-39]|uniref:hypothetical protein n=1 Tax=Enterovirga sp. CN4-39 TaxID=3400910 RepID=UPI003BFCA33B
MTKPVANRKTRSNPAPKPRMDVDLSTSRGVEPLLAASAEAWAKMDHSPEAARARLRKLGILTASGKLTKRFATPKG